MVTLLNNNKKKSSLAKPGVPKLGYVAPRGVAVPLQGDANGTIQ